MGVKDFEVLIYNARLGGNVQDSVQSLSHFFIARGKLFPGDYRNPPGSFTMCRRYFSGFIRWGASVTVIVDSKYASSALRVSVIRDMSIFCISSLTGVVLPPFPLFARPRN